jgi:hypothetical protein
LVEYDASDHDHCERHEKLGDAEGVSVIGDHIAKAGLRRQ